ncbi:MAG: diguanylate cyclase [Nitrospirota bacterium]|nr:diguanylate cyclase [Nitrospirota bacterium]MDH5586122.1 diguanylate cyclase [Nitrospirota bacterium]MDH5774797.1 diguanylate cyclase [Nitrospirota bacterium]
MRILVADDDPLTLHMVVYRLRQWGHDVMSCTDGDSAWKILEGGLVPNVAILDWMMPGLNGPELCQKIRSKKDCPYVYIVLLTGKNNPEDLIVGLDAGADDYLTKPFHLGELEARLRAGKRIVDLQNELISARETLRIQAMQDPLTQILNHGAILDALLTEINRAQRERQPLSLILADLDGFKSVNDTYGHVAGDQVLIEVARRMRNCLRSYDAIGRYGGEEFLVVLPNSDDSQALRLAERIREAICSEPFRFYHVDLTVTISQGVTTWMNPDSIPIERLIQAADRALYGVKNSGRNAVQHIQFDVHAEEPFSPMYVSPISSEA